MLRNFAWKAFERTGNINAYIMYRETDEINDEGDKTVKDFVKDIIEDISKEIVEEGKEMVVSN